MSIDPVRADFNRYSRRLEYEDFLDSMAERQGPCECGVEDWGGRRCGRLCCPRLPLREQGMDTDREGLVMKYPRNDFGYGTQNWRLLEALLRGPLTSLEVAQVSGLAHTRRLLDVKEAIEPQGFTIYRTRISNNPVVHKYWLAEIQPLFAGLG